AIEASDAGAFNAIARQHFEAILGDFDDWARIPAAIRDDQVAVSRYVDSLVAIAQTFEAMGVSTLLARLTGPDETNPIVQWKRRAAKAHSLSEAGEYAESSRILRAILSEIAEATGSAVINLRPELFGRLAFNALHEDDYAAAVDDTRAALAAATAAGDRDSV